MAKILIVEDDAGISDFISLELKHEGFDVVVAETGRQGLSMAESEAPDLILLDIMLPEMNGLEVLRRLRKDSGRNAVVPVIIETARGESVDRINGLNEGADDYICKPFEIEELLARINALLRRVDFYKNAGAAVEAAELICGDLKLCPQTMGLTLMGQSINLSKTEFFMIKHFMENQGKVLSRSDLIDAIWGKDYYIDENTIDVYVGYLRSKFAAVTKQEYIKTVRGFGYVLQPVQ